LQQRRFTASAWDQHGNELALFDHKIDSAQGLDLPIVELAVSSLPPEAVLCWQRAALPAYAC